MDEELEMAVLEEEAAVEELETAELEEDFAVLDEDWGGTLSSVRSVKPLRYISFFA